VIFAEARRDATASSFEIANADAKPALLLGNSSGARVCRSCAPLSTRTVAFA